MATIVPTRMDQSGATVTFAATESGGDQIVYPGNLTVVEFRNTHASAITVSIAPTAAAINTVAGSVATPTRTQSIAAGATWEIAFDGRNVEPYLNASGRLPFTYTSHNVALLVSARRAP